jgi:signal transduction histidine kinase
MVESRAKKTKISEPVSIVAHQLKNPISALYGYLEVLLAEEIGKINQKQREYLADALKNVEAMSRIVKDILDVSKIEEGRYQIKPQPTDLVKTTQEVIGDFSLWAKASNCKILFEKPKKFPLTKVDPSKIRYVVENLISNAITYKSPGPGKIEVSLKKKEGRTLFICKDNGVGIPKEDFKKVFSKFYRSEDAISLYPAGTGLGLYISKAIIDLNKGKIWFEKNKDKGMTFYFSLPVA